MDWMCKELGIGRAGFIVERKDLGESRCVLYITVSVR